MVRTALPTLSLADLSFDALVELGAEAERLGRSHEAIAHYERALTAVSSPEQGAGVARVVTAIARTLANHGDTDAALDCLELGEALSSLACDDESLATQYVNRGVALLARGQTEAAARLFGQSRALAMRVGATRVAGFASQNLGVLALERGDLEEARRFFESALAVYGDTGRQQPRVAVHAALGLVHSHRGAWAAADAVFAQAESLRGRAGAFADAQLDLAIADSAVMRRESGDAASEKIERAMTSAERAGAPLLVCGAQRTAGQHALREGRLTDAAARLAEAARIAREAGMSDELAQVLQAQADLARRRAEPADALRLLLEARALLLGGGRFAKAGALRDVERAILEAAHGWSASGLTHLGAASNDAVAHLIDTLAERLGVDADRRFWWRLGACLREVGMRTVSDAVLGKRGPLSDTEWTAVRSHVVAGLTDLRDVTDDETVLAMVGAHHERWDGAGYPRGLTGSAIPLPARLLAIVDAYCALTSERPHRPALAHEAALERLRRDVGFAFDPTLFAQFEAVMWDGPPAAHDTASAPPLGADALDDLTALLRRSAFASAAAEILADARAHDRETALLVVDLDHFKLINDTFGHLQGDDVLRLVADAMRDIGASIDGGPLLGRYAGDEFVVLVPGCGLSEGCDVAERLRALVASRRCARRDERDATVGVTLSVGVAVQPLHGHTLEELFGAADAGLYQAKRHGRNVVVSAAAPGMMLSTEARLDAFVGRHGERRRLEQRLASAARGSLEVVAIVGEPGIGKAALVRQLAAPVAVRGGRLVEVSVLRDNPRGPLAPWADVVRALGTDAARRVVVDRTLEGLSGAVLEAAASGPLVVLVRDVQHADAAFLDCLETIAQWHRDERLLVCLGARADELAERSAARIARLAGDEMWALEPLPVESLAEWLAAAFGGRLASDTLVQDLALWSGGSPGVARALLSALLSGGFVQFRHGAWLYAPPTTPPLPPAAVAPFADRLALLAPTHRRALATVATHAHPFEPAHLVATGAIAERTLLAALEAARVAGIVRRTMLGPTWEFAHPVVRELLAREAAPARVRRPAARRARARAS